MGTLYRNLLRLINIFYFPGLFQCKIRELIKQVDQIKVG